MCKGVYFDIAQNKNHSLHGPKADKINYDTILKRNEMSLFKMMHIFLSY